MSLLGIDLGTTGVRAAAYTVDGVLLAESVTLVTLRLDRNLAEVDAESVLTAVCDTTAEVVASRAVLDDRVTALSFSVQGEAVVPVDRLGQALAPMPVSMDRRGSRAATEFGDRFGHAAYHAVTGQPLHPMFSIFKVVASPEWASAARYLTLDAFIANRLGGSAATDYSLAARTGAFDVDRRTWSKPILDVASEVGHFAVEVSRLPEVVAPGTAIGAIDEAAASRTGLDVGTTIVAGMHDQAASFLGAGGRPGVVSVYALGSSDCLTVSTRARSRDLDGTGFASYPVSDNQWITLAGTAAGGWAVEWFSDLVGSAVDDVFGEIADEPPRLLVLPYLAGSGTLDNDPLATGVISGLTLETTRRQLARAFLESAGFELGKILDALRSVSIPVGTVRAVGSGARNSAALAVRADAAGEPLAAVSGQASARGAALIAGVGAGIFATIDDVPDAGADPATTPTGPHRDWYAEQRRRYSELYSTTITTNHSLTEHQGEETE